MNKSWTLNDALAVIRQIQPLIRKFNYHVAIGGSLINTGSSAKDADLYFLPLNNGEENKTEELKQFLTLIWGEGAPMGGEGYDEESTVFEAQLKFTHEGRRIDAFIV